MSELRIDFGHGATVTVADELQAKEGEQMLEWLRVVFEDCAARAEGWVTLRSHERHAFRAEHGSVAVTFRLLSEG